MDITPYKLAERYVGMALERPEPGKDHPLICWWLSLCGFGLDAPDETAWCAAFVNGIAWELRLARSKSAAARSWLKVGAPIPLSEAVRGFDIVVFNRGGSPSPADDGPGHVAFFGSIEGDKVLVLGGNQGNNVSLGRFLIADVIGVRRLS